VTYAVPAHAVTNTTCLAGSSIHNAAAGAPSMTDMTVEFDVPATMRDGVVLRADVYRPSAGGPWPVLLTRLPYGKNTPKFIAMLDPIGAARRGFLVVIQDTRGRFASEGDWDPFTFESEDGYDTVRWAAALPHSNGAVGMFGTSYFAYTQWMAALAKPPELRAISPRMVWSDPNDGLFARGGAYELGQGVSWSLEQGFNLLARRHAGNPAALDPAVARLVTDVDNLAHATYWELPSGQQPVFDRHSFPEPGFRRSRREPRWRQVSTIAGRQAEVELPTLHTGAWYDIFCQGTLDNFTASRAAGRPATLIMGPWSHSNTTSQVGDINFGTGAAMDVMGARGRFADLELDWLSQWLTPELAKQAPSSPLPPVLLFVMGTNHWRAEQEWPLPRAVDTSLYLRAGGHLTREAPSASEAPDLFTYDPGDPVPTVGGALSMSSEFLPGPRDQASTEARADVLTYTTEPLGEDLEVTGRIVAHLAVATDAPSTDWVVRLCDVDAQGVSRNVVDGIVRTTVPPGEFTGQTVDLWSTSYVFLAGHRIRVQVTSSNFPRWDRNLNTDLSDVGLRSRPAHQQVAHDAERQSRIVLPTIPASTSEG
jgi:putative CocE/NonD family hydrolase